MDFPATPDIIVIGGGPAGLSAALMLGRACRSMLFAADGPSRNASAAANPGAVIMAAANGTMAAGALNHDWLAEDFEQVAEARD